DRRRRQRTVPGRRPINPPRTVIALPAAAPVSSFPVSGVPMTFRAGPARRRGRRLPSAVHRRRRVPAGLGLLHALPLGRAGGPGPRAPACAPGRRASGALPLAYRLHRPQRAVTERRRRRAAARRAAWLAAREAELRREQARRLAARREALRRAAAARAVAQREA